MAEQPIALDQIGKHYKNEKHHKNGKYLTRRDLGIVISVVSFCIMALMGFYYHDKGIDIRIKVEVEEKVESESKLLNQKISSIKEDVSFIKTLVSDIHRRGK